MKNAPKVFRRRSTGNKKNKNKVAKWHRANKLAEIPNLNGEFIVVAAKASADDSEASLVALHSLTLGSFQLRLCLLPVSEVRVVSLLGLITTHTQTEWCFRL